MCVCVCVFDCMYILIVYTLTLTSFLGHLCSIINSTDLFNTFFSEHKQFIRSCVFSFSRPGNKLNLNLNIAFIPLLSFCVLSFIIHAIFTFSRFSQFFSILLLKSLLQVLFSSTHTFSLHVSFSLFSILNLSLLLS